MTKRIFIVHGWTFNPESYWIPWLKKELEAKGFSVITPEMPNTDEPEINEWVDHLSKTVGNLDEETYFIGHSIGCQTIMRYIEKENSPAGGAVFVGGWFTLKDLEDEETEEIAKPWLETPINYEKVKKNCKITAIFSDNDPFVPINNAELFKKNVNANTIMVKNQGHFETQKQIPIILEEFLKLIS